MRSQMYSPILIHLSTSWSTVLTPFNPPLYFVKRGKLDDGVCNTPSLRSREGEGG